MATLDEVHLTKPVEQIRPENLSHVDKDLIAAGFRQLIEHSRSSSSKGDADVAQSALGFAHSRIPWLNELIPELEELANKYHVGNFVAVRGTNERVFESMPIFVRLGMHLVFYGYEQVRVLEESMYVQDFLREESVRQGTIYDSPESAADIPSFVKTYDIPLDELLEPDVHAYRTFNEFFYRRLKPGARPVQNADDPRTFCAAADSRLVVYQSVSLAQTFWIKGDEFSIPALLGLDPRDPLCQALEGGALALFRLAPADYHRFHSPADGTLLGDPRDIPGQYYTVNPQAVNEPKFDVLTRNKRSVLLLEHGPSKKTIAIVAVGALLVGSIVWTCSREVKHGDELGHFAYGGSTVVAIFPKGLIKFDKDLVQNSIGEGPVAAGHGSIETLVKVGTSLGKMPEGSRVGRLLSLNKLRSWHLPRRMDKL